jgi:hypothetical protein
MSPPNRPFCRAEKKTRTPNAESWNQPKDQGAVADERDELMGIEAKPLLISEYHKRENHCGAYQMIIRITPRRDPLG